MFFNFFIKKFLETKFIRFEDSKSYLRSIAFRESWSRMFNGKLKPFKQKKFQIKACTLRVLTQKIIVEIYLKVKILNKVPPFCAKKK